MERHGFVSRLIRFSAENRWLVVLLTLAAVVFSVFTLQRIRLDAIPDLSDTQVIVFTKWDRSPDIVEDQVTYPIISALLGAPKVKAVRGFSDFGFSYVYVIFQDGTDIYWARSRVVEYMQKIAGALPAGVQPQLGPDATGVGWVYQYALVDRSGQHDLAALRSYQDWYLRYALQSVPGVAEVAGIGGFQKQYQVTIDPALMQSLGVSLMEVAEAIKRSNNEVGGRLIEWSGAEFMVRARGYVRSTAALEQVVVKTNARGTPVLLKDVARVALGPQLRRGVGDLDGLGDTVGGIVVMRHGENALNVIERVKAKLEELKPSLPAGVEVVTTYDRSQLIEEAIGTLTRELVLAMIIVSVLILFFLWHAPSALVPIITIPVSVTLAFIPMYLLGISVNIMSLAGIILSIGVLVDGAIVEVENAYKKIEHWQADGCKGDFHQVRLQALTEVGPSVFFSLAVIAVSFLPVFTLLDQAGRLFTPLAYTKTLTMLLAAILAVTLDPAVRMLFARYAPFAFRPRFLAKTATTLLVGRYYAEEHHPVSRFLFRLYDRPCRWVLSWPRTTIAISALVVLVSLPVLFSWGTVLVFPFRAPVLLGTLVSDSPGLRRADEKLLALSGRLDAATRWYPSLGREFMPPLFEGTILYMPTTVPGLSVTEAQRLMELQDRILRGFPEVVSVYGKAGRADTSTDPAPFSMMETTVVLKPMNQWRHQARWYSDWAPGWLRKPLGQIWPEHISYDQLISEMDRALQIPGNVNAWTMPIKGRIDMLSTGVRTPIGIKILGADLHQIQLLGERLEAVLRNVPGTRSVFAERAAGGYFVDIDPRRDQLARYGLTIDDLHMVVMTALGGETISTSIEGRERYSINLRYPRDFRAELDQLHRVLVPVRMSGDTMTGAGTRGTPTAMASPDTTASATEGTTAERAPGVAQVPLGELATIQLSAGPAMIRNENGMLAGYVFVDVAGRDIGTYVQEARNLVDREVSRPPGYDLVWSGQWENMVRVRERLLLIVPVTLVLIWVLLYMNTKSAFKTFVIMWAVPFSVVGAAWSLWGLDYNISIATWVGLIALMGLDAETGVFMMMFLDLSYEDAKRQGRLRTVAELKEAIIHGAVKRIRPKLMTVATSFMGLLPIMWSMGTGADLMKRVTAPLMGGLATSFLMELLVYPAIYLLWRRRQLRLPKE